MRVVWALVVGSCLVAGCSSDGDPGQSSGGSSGAAGAGASAGSSAGGSAGSSAGGDPSGGSAGQSGGSAGVGGGSGGGAGGTSGAGGAAGTAGSAGAGGAPTCALTDSGPIKATADNQVIEGLRITSTSGPAIDIDGHNGVVVRNVEIVHSGGVGIRVANSDDVVLDHVSIEHTGAPVMGANSSADLLNISCYQSARLKVTGARLTRGSSGIYLQSCPDSKLSFIEGHDFRGPFPRGQIVQWNASDSGVLEDFSVENPPGSWPEDNVNVYKSLNALIRRGLVDGNNSPSGVGVIFDGDTSTGRVEDVDAIRMGNGCFSNYAGADGNVFLRTRCRENICTDQGRGVPSSNALMWAGKPGLSALHIEQSKYYASCNGNVVWPNDAFSVLELREEDFALRGPIRVDFCWE
ncbi:MAG: right-handed parallel beta-helix repeat-containing protein [Polyangiaceae bacterium]